MEAFNKAERERAKLNDLLVKTQDRAADRISAVKSELETQRKLKEEAEANFTQRTAEISQLQSQVLLLYKPIAVQAL